MTRRDWDLLNKQFQRLVPPSNTNGTIFMTIIGTFFVGMMLGGVLAFH
jgi:hypothetical protein